MVLPRGGWGRRDLDGYERFPSFRDWEGVVEMKG